MYFLSFEIPTCEKYLKINLNNQNDIFNVLTTNDCIKCKRIPLYHCFGECVQYGTCPHIQKHRRKVELIPQLKQKTFRKRYLTAIVS